MNNVTSFSQNRRSSPSYTSSNVSSCLNAPSIPQQPHPTSNISTTTTSQECSKLSSQSNSHSNPNSILLHHPPYAHSKRGGMSRQDAEALLKSQSQHEHNTGIKRVEPPQTIIPRIQGRLKLEGPESRYTTKPLSIKGMRWDEKKRVFNEEGHRMCDVISGGYEQKELFGALRSYTDPSKQRTFSHKDVIFPTNVSFQRELQRGEGPSGLELCSEWEKKIVTTQGKSSNMISFKEAFEIDKVNSNARDGTRFVWEVKAEERRRAANGVNNRVEGVDTVASGGWEGSKLYRKSTGENVVIPKLKLNGH